MTVSHDDCAARPATSSSSLCSTTSSACTPIEPVEPRMSIRRTRPVWQGRLELLAGADVREAGLAWRGQPAAGVLRARAEAAGRPRDEGRLCPADRGVPPVSPEELPALEWVKPLDGDRDRPLGRWLNGDSGRCRLPRRDDRLALPVEPDVRVRHVPHDGLEPVAAASVARADRRVEAATPQLAPERARGRVHQDPAYIAELERERAVAGETQRHVAVPVDVEAMQVD